ncbi:hypothetical protein [Promicromonospora soli]
MAQANGQRNGNVEAALPGEETRAGVDVQRRLRGRAEAMVSTPAEAVAFINSRFDTDEDDEPFGVTEVGPFVPKPLGSSPRGLRGKTTSEPMVEWHRSQSGRS